MKKIITFFVVAAVAVACKQEKKQDTQALGVITDSVELAKFNKWKEEDSIAKAKVLVAKEAKPKVVRERRASYASAGENSAQETANSTPTSQKNKGWSKAAKGSVIGAAGGAIVGAVASDKNKGTGAAIGGAVGAGLGYVIGRAEDRKDGRVKPKTSQ